MAFTNTVTSIEELGKGFIIEHGLYDGTAVTTGTITASTASSTEIANIIAFGASSNADTAVICATDTALNELKLTFGSGDAGKYFIIGKAK